VQTIDIEHAWLAVVLDMSEACGEVVLDEVALRGVPLRQDDRWRDARVGTSPYRLTHETFEPCEEVVGEGVLTSASEAVQVELDLAPIEVHRHPRCTQSRSVDQRGASARREHAYAGRDRVH
jgi:hypothetical protein